MLILIIGCEIAFWLLLGLGLVTRYGLRRRRIGLGLLAAVPLTDVVLLVATVIDLRTGAVPRPEHGLAALYLGFSLAFGRLTIDWADGWFAHLLAGGPRPPRPPRRGRERARYEWRLFGRVVVAAVISAVLLLGSIVLVADPARTAPLEAWFPRLGVILAFWMIFGPLIDTPWTDLARRRP